MVDKKLNFLSKNSFYGIINKINPMQNIEHNIVYSDGKSLKYGDPAEIFSAITDVEVILFLKRAATESYYTKEHYWFTCGYQPADYENEEIKENEVRIHYDGVDNTISKKDFYELCLLLCEAKIICCSMNDDRGLKREELGLIKVQLEEKIKSKSNV